MKILYAKKLNNSELKKLITRPAVDFDESVRVVKPILGDVKRNGLKAVLKYAKQFDNFSGRDILVKESEYLSAEKNLKPEAKYAINKAVANISLFHMRQLTGNYEVETMPGVKCSREFRPIEQVGIYIPGGSAVLPSTLMMLAVPAKLAGCKRIVACSPGRNNKINDEVLYAAKLTGVTEFYKIGGAHSIALMAYGTNKIKKVDKIFGPGNQYVTAAKMLISIDSDGCAIDMPAGPSEVLIIADNKADATFIAADLLSQAEHGADSQVVLLSDSDVIIKKTLIELEKQLEKLPRKNIAAKALENSFALVTDNLEEAITFSNNYAPEHLILHLQNADRYRKKIINAGSVFLGCYSPESVGDYASGTNHSLPTYGYAKSFGGVTVDSFRKSITFQKLTSKGLKQIAPVVETLAEIESLDAHKNAVTIRMKNGNRKASKK